jgi:hypothetical protein
LCALLLLLLLGSTAQLRPWPPPQSSSIKNGWISWRLLNIFYRVGLLVPRSTPTLEDQASVFIPPRGRVAQLYPQVPGTHFSRLLRHAWVTVGLFLFPGHHTGKILSVATNILNKQLRTANKGWPSS